MYLDLFKKEVLVVGCGNPLLGDDGFGPAVIEYLEALHPLQESVGLLDAGTSIRELLFDLLLSEKIPGTFIVIDAVQHSKAQPGEIVCINVDEISENKIADYCIHQFPTTNMLKELKESSRIDIQIYAVQITSIAQTINPGLSLPVQKAVKKMGTLIQHKLEGLFKKNSCTESFSC